MLRLVFDYIRFVIVFYNIIIYWDVKFRIGFYTRDPIPSWEILQFFAFVRELYIKL